MGMIKSTIKTAILVGGTYALATHSFDVSAAPAYIAGLLQNHFAATSGISLTTVVAMAKTYAMLDSK